MGNEKMSYCFLGTNSYSYGIGSVDNEYILKFKLAGDIFGKLTPIIRNENAFKYLYRDIPEYDPIRGELTGKITRFVFIGLEKGQKEFSFRGNIPAEFKIHYETMMSEIKFLRNGHQKLLNIVDTLNVDDFDKKKIQEAVKFSREIVNSYGGQQVQQQK